MSFKATAIDPLLDGDMRPGLKLEVAFFGVRTVVLLHGALDIDRVGVMPLDQIAVVTVHRPDQIRERVVDAFR